MVSFVFQHSGAPFAKKGGADLSLPSMDIPISLMNWEVFLPERYKVKDFGGDVIAANRVPQPFREETRRDLPQQGDFSNLRMQLLPGQIGGYVTDPTGAVVPNAQIAITSYDGSFSRTAVTDATGGWIIAGLPSGSYKAIAQRTGFRATAYNVNYNANQPGVYNFALSLGSTSEVVEVTAEAPMIQAQTSSTSLTMINGNPQQNQPPKLAPGAVSQAASMNVLNLQKRIAGVLPVPIDVPRAGTSFSFVRPLVLDEETKVTFTYKSR